MTSIKKQLNKRKKVFAVRGSESSNELLVKPDVILKVNLEILKIQDPWFIQNSHVKYDIISRLKTIVNVHGPKYF
ncbi:12357_t:CDS:2, partial [Entrophospora sp. SA101]